MRRTGTLTLILAAVALPLCTVGALPSWDDLGPLGSIVILLVVAGAAADAAGAVAYLQGRPGPARRLLLVGACLLLPSVLPALLTVAARLLIGHEHGLVRETRTRIELPPHES